MMGKLNLVPLGGELTGLRGWKLFVTVPLFAVFGGMNTIGVGSYPVTVFTVYAMGLNPVVAFPIMMGACACSVPAGSAEFIRLGQYGRKVSMVTALTGTLGVFLAVFIVKSMSIALLQWLLAIILLYSSSTMLYGEYSRKKQAA